MNIYDSRTVGGFGLSIGTDLMLESLFIPTGARFDDTRVIPNKLSIDKYDFHVYNIYTLIRNILHSVPHKDKEVVISHKDFLNTLIDEVNIITSLYHSHKCKPILFIPDYTKVLTKVNDNKEVSATKNMEEHVMITKYIKKYNYTFDIHTISNTYKLPKLTGAVLITTSYPLDLNNNLTNLTLLESHTGKLKLRYEWYTKYHKVGTKELTNIPFMEELLFILGDNYLVKPMKIPLRVELHELAASSNWSARTTHEKVMSDIRKSANLKQVLNGYHRLY